jgi:hypothetical protein
LHRHGDHLFDLANRVEITAFDPIVWKDRPPDR